MKASAITAKEMVERSRQIHKTLPVATAALGRSLMAASMMGNQLKEKDGSVTLRIKGGGPLGGITVVSDSQGNARGYVVNPLVDLPLKGPAKLDVGSAVGRDGSLTVIKARRFATAVLSPPRILPPTLLRVSRSPPPVPWACWWTWTRACSALVDTSFSSSPAQMTPPSPPSSRVSPG